MTKGDFRHMCKLMEEYEKRTLNRFMKKLTVPGEKCNLKMRMNLRYACFKFLGMYKESLIRKIKTTGGT